MKKLASLLLVAAVAFMYSCGPSEAEKEKARQDSIAKADSIANVEKARQDSIDNANALKEQAYKDSIHQDSVKKFPKLFKNK